MPSEYCPVRYNERRVTVPFRDLAPEWTINLRAKYLF